MENSFVHLRLFLTSRTTVNEKCFQLDRALTRRKKINKTDIHKNKNKKLCVAWISNFPSHYVHLEKKRKYITVSI